MKTRMVFQDAALLARADAATDRGELLAIVEYLLALAGEERGEDVSARGPDTPLCYSRSSWAERLRAIWAQEARTRRHVAELERAGLVA